MTSVRAKLFFGFYSMAMIIALLGAYAFVSISNAGTVVKETFDRPLMSINFARQASQVFNEAELRILQAQGLNGSEINAELVRQDITYLMEDFKSSIIATQERSMVSKSDRVFSDLTGLIDQWTVLAIKPERSVEQTHEIALISKSIEKHLNTIVELQTDDSFRHRETALRQLANVKLSSLLAGAMAFLLTVILSGWVAVTIIRPLNAAADVARRISAGDLDVVIPEGGEDETGALLKTIAAMQESLRERISVQQNLRAVAQTRLVESLENSKDAILMTGPDRTIIVANQRLHDIFPTLGSIDLHDKQYDEFFTLDGVPNNDLCEYFEKEREIRFWDGRWARVNASNTKEGGRLVIWTDITQSKLHSARLLVAKEQAEAADKSKSLFLATMSHELRTPLNAVIGFSDIIHAQSLGRVGNERYVQMAKLISQSGEHLLGIVKDVLSIANGGVDAEQLQENKAFCLTSVLTQSVKIIRLRATKKDIQLYYKSDLPEVYIRGDSQKLQEIFQNVLSNAVKFNHKGGAIKVRLDVGRNGAVRVDIIDNGIGISQTDLVRIQEPFVQVDNGFTRQYDGVGLGLSIVRKHVEAHDGKVSITSKLDKGTCVSLFFPALEKQAPRITNLESEDMLSAPKALIEAETINPIELTTQPVLCDKTGEPEPSETPEDPTNMAA